MRSSSEHACAPQATRQEKGVQFRRAALLCAAAPAPSGPSPCLRARWSSLRWNDLRR